MKEDIEKNIKSIENSTDQDQQMKKEQLQFCCDNITFTIEEIVDDIYAENDIFFEFAYILRKKDDTCKYTQIFL